MSTELPTQEKCGHTKAPAGWSCTRTIGHPGPCAAEQDAPITAEGIIPSARAAVALADIADELHGSFDEQTYDEMRRMDWDQPDDYVFCVNVTSKQLRLLTRAILILEGKQ